MRRRQTTSRLSRTSERQNKRQAVTFTIGIILLIVILFEFGPALINIFGNFIYSLRGGDKTDNTQVVGNAFIQPPILSGIPDATQSAYISFSGLAPDTNGKVEIYVNGYLSKEVNITDNTNFNVDSLTISSGQNTVKARFVKDNKTSGFSQDYQVSYIKDKPKLDISFPSDGASFTKADKNITVTGTTDSDSSVSVNGFRAIVDSEGKFTYLLTLNNGDNTISIEAQNPAGLTTDKTLKVTYSP